MVPIPSCLPNLAFDSLKEAEITYNETGAFSERVLEILHSFFGENLLLATELLEKCKLIEYSTENASRNIFKIITTFRLQVLQHKICLTCKHVLAVKLGKITNVVITEKVTGSQLVDFLNEQLNCIEDEET